MSLPEPIVPLDNICSVIFNNTLYTYSADAFQSLRLEEGAEWKKLPSGEKVTGGVCVGSTPGDDSLAGFYVVGGKGSTDYQGFQKYTYSTGKWESLTPVVAVTQDRQWHGATYLNASDSILMYAGSQDGTQYPSTQTFTIGASAPYSVIAYQSIAPPTINPILLPWSASSAMLIGGSTTNTKVMTFSPETSWQDSGASLAAPIEKDITAIRAVIITGDDGCKNLYTFDMTQSPNEVNRTVLIDGSGAPVPNSAPITRRSLIDSSKRRSWRERRQTLGDWPQYNDTLAPSSTRTNYAVAEDPNGLVVVAGGNDDDVLCMFDARENSWQNATEKLVDQKVFALSEPSSSSTITSATATSTSGTITATSSSQPSETAAAAATKTQSSGLGTNSILGIVLGSIFGSAIILVLLYFCIRRQRARQGFMEAGHNRRASGASSPEKDGMGFANDSLPPRLGAGVFRGHNPQDSHGSVSSMAILMGKVNQQNKQQQQQQQASVGRKISNGTKRSSSSSLFNKQFKSTISKPIPQMAQNPAVVPGPEPLQPREEKVMFAKNTAEPRPVPRGNVLDRQGSTRRSSGWNRYWSGGSALNILGFGNGNNNGANAGNRATVDSDQSSHYSNQQNRITQDSATVPPLQIDGRPRFSRVNSGSPTIDQWPSRMQKGMSAQIERPSSRVSDMSGYSSGIPASVHDTWDPTSFSNKPWGADRAPSSAYSLYTTPLVPPSQTSRQQQHPPSRGGVPSGVSQQPQLAMAATSSDMSWLNLGETSRY